ncbi:MAG: OmpA family protein, partial [Deltaproteobacteria bacterium]|nr:OmpA family protein [Deltaproteobacteria bacterium]
NDHCRAEAGETCVSGICQNCKVDADCVQRTPEGQDPWTCNAFRCGPAGGVADAVPGVGGEEGDPCVQTTECLGGLVCTQGACALCTDDIECSGSGCNLDTGRCGPQGACQTDDQCAMDEICDGGMCVFSGELGDDGGGPCGLPAVYFAFDSDEITPQTQEELTTLATCLQEQGRKVFLEAHADDRGTEEYNILLTERRGLKVKNFLIDKGSPRELMQVIAKGSLEATGNDESARAKDRRVAFIWPE